MKRLLASLLLCLTLPAGAFERIASLNLCVDQILLNWVAPEKIVSVTWLSANDHYRRAPLPQAVHLNRGQAEELLRLQPDLVLVGQYGAGRAATRLGELGVNVVTIPDAYNLDQLQQQLLTLQQTLGATPQLEAQRQRLQQLLERPVPESGPTAMILSANNITYGSGMLEHELLQRAGFTNLAAGRGDARLQRVTLEEIIAAQPDLLVFYGGEQEFALAHLATRHPVLQNFIDRDRVITLPEELSFCPALVAADALQQLTQKRNALVRQR